MQSKYGSTRICSFPSSYSDSSFAAKIFLARYKMFASARTSSCEHSTPKAILIVYAIRSACFLDQNRKSSEAGVLSSSASVAAVGVDDAVGAEAEVGMGKGSASRQRLVMGSRTEWTDWKSNAVGLDTGEARGTLVGFVKP